MHKNGCRSSNLTIKLAHPRAVSMGAYTGPCSDVGRRSNMDMYRILVIHAPPLTLLFKKREQKQWATGWCEHGSALYRCPSVCQYAWVAYGDHFRHVGRGSSVDMYRILIIHVLARAMWIRSTGSRIVCLWMVVAWMRPV